MLMENSLESLIGEQKDKGGKSLSVGHLRID